jgi:hypothetical protein
LKKTELGVVAKSKKNLGLQGPLPYLSLKKTEVSKEMIFLNGLERQNILSLRPYRPAL